MGSSLHLIIGDCRNDRWDLVSNCSVTCPGKYVGELWLRTYMRSYFVLYYFRHFLDSRSNKCRIGNPPKWSGNKAFGLYFRHVIDYFWVSVSFYQGFSLMWSPIAEKCHFKKGWKSFYLELRNLEYKKLEYQFYRQTSHWLDWD